MPPRKRSYQEPMSHDYLQEMIVAASSDATVVTLTIAEAEVLMGEFAFNVARVAKLEAQLRRIVDHYDTRLELYAGEAEAAGGLAAIARQALNN